jgi:hypothetical protein
VTGVPCPLRSADSFLCEIAPGLFPYINRVPERDHVDDEPERAELIFLTLAVTLPQFAPFAAGNDALDAVSTFGAIELRQRDPVHVFVVDIAKRM